MNQLAPIGSGGGNTKPPRISAAKNWCFTAYRLNPQELIELIGSKGSYIFGEEKCPTTGTYHLQGYIEFKDKCRPLESVKSVHIHWEKTKGTKDDNIKYCSKDGKFHTNMKIKKPLKIIEKEKLFKWQLDILDIIKNDPDERLIYWFWEPTGNTGKTTFAKYLAYHHEAIPLEGKKNDILYCAAMFESDIYIWDIERSLENFISYGAIEKIKKGFFMCAKYESKPILRNCCHIFCFANFPPDVSKMSADMWKVIRIE